MAAELAYQLQDDGSIHDWLVTGPQAIPVGDLARFGEQGAHASAEHALHLAITRHYHVCESGIAQPPAEQEIMTIDETKLTWQYVRCEEDHFVDRTAFYPTCHYLRSWAYTQVVTPALQEATCILTTNGPADVWLNGQPIHRQEHVEPTPHSIAFQAVFQEGRNEILVRFEQVAIRDCPYVMALRIAGLPAGGLPVLLPTTIAQIERRATYERVFAAAYLDRAVYGKNDQIVVRWPEELAERADVTVRLQRPTGQIYVEAQARVHGGATRELGQGLQYKDGAYQVILLFTMALNSFQGAFGSTHGLTDPLSIKDARLEPTSGIGRLLWGMGNFNEHMLGIVGLSCATNYELPAFIAGIAADQPDQLWSRERHAGTLEPHRDGLSGTWEVNKVTYKTPDYMLCSAQDHQPGQAGNRQQIWQATLAPDATIFVTHPAYISPAEAHHPGFWHGNAILPQVAQWKDVLIAIHQLPADDWLGFTHAHFPLAAFDEHTLRGGWAFARKGAGYLALTAARGLALVRRGDSAGRELRSYGQENVWLCHMGGPRSTAALSNFKPGCWRSICPLRTWRSAALRCVAICWPSAGPGRCWSTARRSQPAASSITKAPIARPNWRHHSWRFASAMR